MDSPQGAGRIPAGSAPVSVEGGACRDRIEFGISLEGLRVVDAGFIASGCGALTAAASAAVTLTRGRTAFETASVGSGEIATELGGLSRGKLHAAEVASEALARALGAAIGARPARSAPAEGRTLVAMSGGVDSAVAALLSARAGDAVTVTLELWGDSENDAERSCCSSSAVAQARALAHSMGLPHFTLDVRDAFRAGVVEPFIAGYAGGETPNPCVSCNGHVRLDAMLGLADRLGCRWLATGHYARTAEPEHDAGPLLRAAADPAKDQTYMLSALAPESLARMRFPLGGLRKPRVREIARAAGLPVASKLDSQDLCFLAGTDRARFLSRHGGLGERPGLIEDRDGRVLGEHRGQHNFTVGQRRGLGVSGHHPLYVLDKHGSTNTVVVGPRAALRADRVSVRGVRLHRGGERVDRVKLRYRSRPLRARLAGGPEAGHHRLARIDLAEPAEGPAPGQLACLMDGELIIGWGTIARS